MLQVTQIEFAGPEQVRLKQFVIEVQTPQVPPLKYAPLMHEVQIEFMESEQVTFAQFVFGEQVGQEPLFK